MDHYYHKAMEKHQIPHNERDSETNYDHREARNSDSGWGRFWGVDALAGEYPAVSPYCYVGGNLVRVVDPGGRDTAYYFNKSGEIVERKYNGVKPPQIFVTAVKITGVSYTEVDNNHPLFAILNKMSDNIQVNMSDDLGYMIRTVYAEMANKSFTDKQIVAESIQNRTLLPSNVPEYESSYTDAVSNSSNYEVSNLNNEAYKRYATPLTEMQRNSQERHAFLESVGASVKTHYNESSKIGGGVIFYNSANASIYDGKEGFEKLNIPQNSTGMKGMWKLTQSYINKFSNKK